MTNPKDPKDGRKLGAHGEAQIERAFNRHLPHNFDREQVQGSNKPDFSVHDNDGGRVAFVESKTRLDASKDQRSSTHDFKQTLGAIKQTSKMTSQRELNVCAPGGKNFFKPKHQSAIDRFSRRVGVRVVYWDRSEADAMARHLKTLANGKSRPNAGNKPQPRPAPGAAKPAQERLRVKPASPQRAQPRADTKTAVKDTAKPSPSRMRVNPQGSSNKPRAVSPPVQKTALSPAAMRVNSRATGAGAAKPTPSAPKSSGPAPAGPAASGTTSSNVMKSGIGPGSGFGP